MELITSALGFVGFACISEIVKICIGVTDKDFKKFFFEIELCNKSKEYPTMVKKTREKYYMKYTFRLPLGLSVLDVKKHEESISSFLECENVIVEKQKNSRMIDVLYMHTKPRVKYGEKGSRRKDFKIPLGVNLRTGDVFLWDIFKDTNTNVYIAGSPGQGKTNILNLILGHLANCKNEDEVQFAINDTKMVDLPIFRDCRNTVSYSSGTEYINEFLDEELKEMNARFSLLKKYGFKNLRDFRNAGYNLPFRVVVIEEISVFSDNEKFQKQLSDLTSKGRSAGITVILVTQIPTYDIMPTRIKNNVNTSIGLKVRDNIRSEIVMNDAELHKLSGCGHFKISDSDNYNAEVQSYEITDSCLKKIIKTNNRGI